MSIYEYDEEAVLEMLKEEYREDGMAEGIELGIEQGITQGEDNILKLMTKMFEAGEGDKVKLLSEDAELLATMREKYLNGE